MPKFSNSSFAEMLPERDAHGREHPASTRELLIEFELRAPAIRKRLQEFSAVPASEYFHELLYCLLTPQTSAVACAAGVEKLREQGFASRDFDPEPLLRGTGKGDYIRFHRTKSRNLLEAKLRFAEIEKELNSSDDVARLRLWLVENVKGLGMKEASHFLRNTGRTGVVILDRHILRNMVRYSVIESVPKSMTPGRYLDLERRFKEFARALGMLPDELDLFWWSQETGFILK